MLKMLLDASGGETPEGFRLLSDSAVGGQYTCVHNTLSNSATRGTLRTLRGMLNLGTMCTLVLWPA